MPKPTPRFAGHPGVAHQQAIASNLKNTGKTLQEWVRLTRKAPAKTAGERVRWLKAEHGVGMATAQVIAQAVEGKNADDYRPQQLVDQMFAGAKTALRPIYDELTRLALALGKDVTTAPCKSFVPLRRRHVFAQIKPATNSRIDLGLALGTTKASARLLDTGGLAKGDRITHRIAITSLDEIDTEVKRWLKAAFEMDA